MKKKFLISVGLGIVIIAILLAINFGDYNEGFKLERSLELDFTYSGATSKLKDNLQLYGISMSPPVEIREAGSIEKYCSFFEDKSKQEMIEYCISTELIDLEGNFLGNIHMVGSPKLPKLVMVLIQADPFMNQLDEIKSVFRVVLENLVCNCWEEIKPSDIKSIDEWIDRHREFHTSDIKPHSKSNLSLEGKQLQIELTTNNEGYLWKLFIAR